MKKCQKHKKYTGKRKPTNQCVDCLSVYIKLGGGRRLPTPPPTKIIKDKTKYTRKSKHGQRFDSQ